MFYSLVVLIRLLLNRTARLPVAAKQKGQEESFTSMVVAAVV
jgi:hypothetical protein